MPLQTIKGNILELELGENDFIAYQCDCAGLYPSGLAKELFKKYPRHDIYKDGTLRRAGGIVVRGQFIHIMGQYLPGDHESSLYDTKKVRLEWFVSALKKIPERFGRIDNIYIPEKLGCNTVYWETYLRVLKRWASNVDFNVIVVE